MESIVGKHWHHLPAEEVVALLETHVQHGLPLFEAKHRQKHFGPNRITERKRTSAWKRFLLQFHQPLIYILLAATAVTFLLGEFVDGSVIFGVVLLNAIVGYIQESKAEKAIESLKKMVTTEATVVRDGKKQRIASVELTPGDLVLLQSGDKVPADLRLVQVRDLQVDEAALTGESVPVQKTTDILPPETILADRTNMAYAGTLVTYGQGAGVVIAIGDATETGRISHLISEAADIATPLARKIAAFSRLLLVVIVGLAGFTFVVGLLRGEPAVEMFMAAVALAVGAIPEGLPAAVTIMLAIGVRRMAQRRAIIRKLPAVETLGSTTVICSDKTGTLTESQMTVQKIMAENVVYDVTGAGYSPEGQIMLQGARVDVGQRSALRECLLAGMLCNDARLVSAEGRWAIEGDPTEGALIVAARKAGIDPQEVESQLPRIDVIPFESERQYMATLHSRKADGEKVVYLKGAVERVLERCTNALNDKGELTELRAGDVARVADEMAASGLRVLAFARGAMPADHVKFGHDHVASGMTFLGLQGMIDPPRAEAIAAVRECAAAGIRVKMITGDHALTAMAIAKQLGLDGEGKEKSETIRALTGKQMTEFSDRELVETVEETAVFARVAPEQKLRLVEALQARGHVVAMTGDGVNDAPALKQADIGIAMGITGTDVSKEAADMVLTDDNFASIVSAVREGRRVFDNLTKFIVWTLPTNGGEGLIILAAILLGVALPVLPVQILWINMTTALLLGLMLVFELEEADTMQRPPRPPDSPILTLDLLGRILGVSGLMLIAAFGLFLWHKGRGGDVAEARTIAVNVVVMVELFYVFNCRSLRDSVFSIGVFSNHWLLAGVGAMILAQILFTYAPWMNHLFHSAPVSLEAWGMIVAASAVVYGIIELEKYVRRKFGLGAQQRIGRLG